ncbi:MAG: ABC transporter ATP-binding protein [Actinomycetota bacterium]|nr:ABC transporter ATP-binding protein [Actinomycetota bacterium]MDQ3217390.1 ABC transporter ATP-binding protein [Actinomycetota bacterium]
MTPTAIRVRGLRKSYGELEAVKGIDLDVAEGRVFALLGPNGAGKTTIVEILEGYRNRSAGEVSVLGSDPRDAEASFRRRVGIVLQSTGVEPYLTVSELIEQFRGYYPDPRPLDETIELVGLTAKRNDRVKRLSGGQQRRLDVALGLAGNPDLLFLDEPTTGFDPGARRDAWQMIRNLRELGVTVFLTTHYMDEAQSLADEVAILVDGRIAAQGPPAILTSGKQTRIRFRLPEGTPPPGGSTVAGDAFEIHADEPTRELHELTSWAVERGVELDQLTVSHASLEDVYLELTQPENGGGR